MSKEKTVGQLQAAARNLEGAVGRLAGIRVSTPAGRQALRLVAADLTILANELEKARNAVLTLALESAMADLEA